MNPRMEMIDLRPMPAQIRFEKIFQVWSNLKSGETLKVINDHDPRPLRYHFATNHEGEFQWEYEQDGLKDWIVNIKRV